MKFPRPAPRSFGFTYNGVFIQGTVILKENSHELAGLYGDKAYESINELNTVTGLPKADLDTILAKITNLVNYNG